MAKISAKSREIIGKKVKRLRQEKVIPAVAYGPSFESTSISFDLSEFNRLFKEVGFSQAFDITIDDNKQERAIIKNVSEHPITDQVLNVEVYIIDKTKPITADIPLVFEGVAPAEDQGLGFLIYNDSSIAVRSLPAVLPSELVVDLSSLVEVGSSIHANDVVLPEGVELDSGQDEHAVVVYVETAQKAVEEEETDELEGEESMSEDTSEESEE